VAERRSPRAHPCRLLALGLACAGLLAGCGNTLQNQPLTATTLEPLVTAEHFPVYWLGARFDGMTLSSVSSDPSGAFAVQYGNCTRGGPETCVAPLQLVSSPDNSFLPGAAGRFARQGAAGRFAGTKVRGVSVLLLQGGRVVEIATGPAVVDVRAASPDLALRAVREMVPVNELGKPGAALPTAQPNTGFAGQATEAQRQRLLRGLTASESRPAPEPLPAWRSTGK
jgi:hypothetical protein